MAKYQIINDKWQWQTHHNIPNGSSEGAGFCPQQMKVIILEYKEKNKEDAEVIIQITWLC